MSLEEALRENTAALKENTAAHLALANVAKKAQSEKASAATEPTAETSEDDDAKKKAAAKKAAETRARKKAEKEAAEKEEAAKDAPEEAGEVELSAEVSWEEVTTAAKAFMNHDEEEDREKAKERMGAAFKHLGIKKLPEIEEDDEARAKLAAYIAHWNAGEKVVFRTVDEAIAALSEGGSSEDDNDLGI